jgi:subtilase family serine protease
VTIPCGTAPGTYYIVARADADGTVLESNETNNDRSVAITITVGGPDLVISSLSAPSLARRCQTITVKSTTKNTGSSAAGSSAANLYYSTSSTYSSGAVFIGSRIISQLAAGASSSGDLSIQVPCGMSPGRYYLIGRADADNAVAETNENNNFLSKSIYIYR